MNRITVHQELWYLMLKWYIVKIIKSLINPSINRFAVITYLTLQPFIALFINQKESRCAYYSAYKCLIRVNVHQLLWKRKDNLSAHAMSHWMTALVNNIWV